MRQRTLPTPDVENDTSERYGIHPIDQLRAHYDAYEASLSRWKRTRISLWACFNDHVKISTDDGKLSYAFRKAGYKQVITGMRTLLVNFVVPEIEMGILNEQMARAKHHQLAIGDWMNRLHAGEVDMSQMRFLELPINSLHEPEPSNEVWRRRLVAERSRLDEHVNPLHRRFARLRKLKFWRNALLIVLAIVGVWWR